MYVLHACNLFCTRKEKMFALICRLGLGWWALFVLRSAASRHGSEEEFVIV